LVYPSTYRSHAHFGYYEIGISQLDVIHSILKSRNGNIADCLDTLNDILIRQGMSGPIFCILKSNGKKEESFSFHDDWGNHIAEKENKKNTDTGEEEETDTTHRRKTC
jgi:hypothetical protein